MSRVSAPGSIALDSAKYCLAHRCAEHQGVRMHNVQGPQGSECGACVMADVVALHNMLQQVLDGYAARLSHHAVLLAKLRQARERLNMISPGAGDWLDSDVPDVN
jgi:hypothetical protein